MRINHNLSALNAWRQITLTDSDMKKSLERLSSGLRINRASDDAAGLAISEKMRGQIRGLEMAMKNAQDGISLIQTAEGALNEVHAILQRMRELAVQAATDTNTNVDRDQLQAELNQLREEIDRIARATEFNTKKLLDGKLEGFRFRADVKVVTGGNIDLKAEEINISKLNTKAVATWTSQVVNGSIKNVYLDVGNSTYDFVYRKLSTNIGTDLWVGFKSVGNNQVRVVVFRDAPGTMTIGSNTLSGDGKVYLHDFRMGNNFVFMGALSVDLADGANSSLNTVYSAKLVDSKMFVSANGFLTESIRTNIEGTNSIPVINLGGGNYTSFVQVFVHGVAITLAFKSVSNNSILVTAIRNGTVLGSYRYDQPATSTTVSFKLIKDVRTANTLLNISNISIRITAGGERIALIQFNGTAYFDTVNRDVVAKVNNVLTNASSLTFTSLLIGTNAKVFVGFQSVGTNQVRYVVKSFSGMTITTGTIKASDLNSIGLKTVNLGDDLVLNIQFENFQSEMNRLNQADLYVTSRVSKGEEGSYVLEIGQLKGYVSSPIDFRLVKSSSTGISISTVGELRRGFLVKNGIVMSWMPDIWRIDMYGSLPNEEVIDTAVFRVDEQRMEDNSLIFQIGSNEGVNMMLGIDDMRSEALGLTKESVDVTTQNAAERTIMIVDAAILKVGMVRSRLGAVQNRLEHTIANLGVAAENLTAAESRIRDADMAKEMMAFTKQQILMQSGMAMLAQANGLPQNVLQLLRG